MAAKYKLPDGYHKMLGSDPEEYEANAKLLAKDLGNKHKGPSLEGGNNNASASVDKQRQAAAATVKKKFAF